MFSARLSTKHVALACRSLSTSLRAGIPVAKAFDIAVNKSGDSHLRSVMRDVATQIRAGSDVASACRSFDGLWPDLFLNMIDVADRTGSLPEVLLSLADHYENNVRLLRDFRSQMVMPLVQLFAAVMIVAFMIWLLGEINLAEFSGKPGAGNQQAFDIVGLGLKGVSGSLIWLSSWAMAAVSLFVAYQIARRSTAFKSIMHKFLMGIPVVGTCLQSFAIARFSWAFALTQEAGLPIQESLESSLAATDNGAFQAAAPRIVNDVMNGLELTDALAHTKLFPEDFIQIVHVGETSGTVPETLARLSPEFEDQARRSLAALTSAIGWVIWLMVAGFIGYIVIRFFMLYAELINTMSKPN
ncbi:MAG: type II secretion system F family protein [Planctomycetaceae bacterium]